MHARFQPCLRSLLELHLFTFGKCPFNYYMVPLSTNTVPQVTLELYKRMSVNVADMWYNYNQQ